MIPLSLTLEGIYSYQKRQTIDFAELTSAKLFGIFGSVGSGKSTILEAISFALYGQTERLNKNDSPNYNMMNLKSNEFFLEFDFKAGTKYEEEYKFVVKTKRNRKNYEDVGAFDRKCYQKVKGEWLPLEDKTAEKIIGLSYENFRRTVIIPQGKFQEFIGLTEKDRTNMLKELFSLDRFDLFFKTAGLDAKNKAEMENVKGQLEQVSLEATPEIITAKENEKIELESLLEKFKAQEIELDKKEKVFSELKVLFENINILNENLSSLKEKSEEFARKESQLKNYEICEKNFKDLLTQKQKLDQDFSDGTKALKEKKALLLNFITAKEQSAKELAIIKPEFENREALNQKATDLASLQQIKKLDVLLQQIQKEIEILAAQKKVKNQEQNALKEQLKLLAEERTNVKKTAPDWELLTNVQNWFTEKNNLLKNIAAVQKEIAEHEQDLQKIQEEKITFLSEPVINECLTEAQKTLKVPEIIAALKASELKEGGKLGELEKSLVELQLNEKLGDFVSQLQDDQPCPLCGSREHPEILQVESVQVDVAKIKTEKEIITTRTKVLSETMSKLRVLYEKFTMFYKEKKKLEEKLALNKEDLQKHLLEFKWEMYQPDNEPLVKEAVKKASEVKVKIEALENSLEELNEKLDQAAKETEKVKELLESKEKQKAAETSKKETMLAHLKLLAYETYLFREPSVIEQEICELNARYEKLNKDFSELTEQVNKLNQEISQVQGQIKSEEANLEKLALDSKDLVQEINERLKIVKLENIAAVEKILAVEIDLAKEQAVIKEYNESLLKIEATLKSEQQKIKDQTYNPEAHAVLLAELEALKLKITQNNEAKGALLEIIKKLKQDLETRNKLSVKLEALRKREANLATLKKLFKGSGFVNFISTKYLQNLCNAANERFHKLTRQQLKLEITASNSFQVRDYLYEGKVRSIKTLSGGQTFQAAFSLALALADQVNQLVGAKQNFFFLDEGFGTLDSESMHIVFDSLKSLHKENRIVGVISHVEDMQREIDVYLKVKNDDEAGSLIERSWG